MGDLVMGRCSVVRNIRIAKGTIEEYKRLARFHYRGDRPAGYSGIFKLILNIDDLLLRRSGDFRYCAEKGAKILPRCIGAYQRCAQNDKREVQKETEILRPEKTSGLRMTARGYGELAGVIVYTMPVAGLEMRNAATGGRFCGFDRGTSLALLNANVRCISRVIIEPRFRGLGLAVRLVRETMPLMDVPIIEAMAVMGAVNPFFEKAGMRAYAGPMAERCVRLSEALSMVGIEEREMIDPQLVQKKIEGLSKAEAGFIEAEMGKFLQSYGGRRRMQAGIERTEFVLGKLTERPIYYVWIRPQT